MANKTKRPQQQDEWEDESTLKKVPVTLLSGFLGAGKYFHLSSLYSILILFLVIVKWKLDR